MNKSTNLIVALLAALLGLVAVVCIVYFNNNVEGPMKACAEMCKPHGVKRFQPSGTTREGGKWLDEKHLMSCECQGQ